MPRPKKPIVDFSQKTLVSFNFVVPGAPTLRMPSNAQTSIFNYLPSITHLRRDPPEIMEIEAGPKNTFEIPKDKPQNEESERKVKKSVQTKKSQDNTTNRPDHNLSYTYKQKYDVMKGILDYLNGYDAERTTVKLCEELGQKNSVKYQTCREWYYQVKKDRTIVAKIAELCSNERYAQEKGHMNVRTNSRTSCTPEVEQELIDWVYFCIQIGILLIPSQIQLQARELNKDPSFKATHQWLKGFFNRHALSMRAITTKIKREETPERRKFIEDFKVYVHNVIDKFKIIPRDVINIDETPMYWEFLPNRIVFKKGQKVVPGAKTSNSYKRSTLLLGCNIQGDLLRPTMILKRKSNYTLKCQNNIGLHLQCNPKGWTTTTTMIDWIETILVPHLQGRHGLLLLDSYEAHKSEEVRNFTIANHPNIHCCIIPGGYTDVLQPLDMGINSVFKRHCKQEALKFTNERTLAFYNENRNASTSTPHVSLRFMIGIILLIIYLSYLDEQETWMIAEKDLSRRSKDKPKFSVNIEVEDIYDWIEKAYQKLSQSPQTIINCFYKAGFTSQQVIEEDHQIQNPIPELALEYDEVFEPVDGTDRMLEERKEEDNMKYDDSK